jgi:hypothetical protein
MAKQKKVSIPEDEWEIAERRAKEEHFSSVTGWIRHLIRQEEA